jgi:short-subunit dehydrogenase
MSPKLKPIDQQVFVITGASSGIGLATAQLAAQQGASVVLAARSSQTLEEIVSYINSHGGRAHAVMADVADRQHLDVVAEEAISQFGRIDTWVNNAGLSIYGRLDEVSEEDNRRLFDVNFWGVVNGSLVALPYLKQNQNGGALINVGSEVSEAVVPLLGMYSVTKHAVKGFTDALRIEVEEIDKAPISITLIQPTATNTPFPHHAKNYMDKEPALPSPTIDPRKVAEAIISAAQKPQPAIKVGAMSKMNTFIAKAAPGLGEWLATKQVGQFKGEESPRNPEGALYCPSETAGDSGRIHGEGATA